MESKMNDHNEQATSANEGRLIGNAEREEGAARWRIQINVKEWEEGINFDLWRWIRRARPTSLNEGEWWGWEVTEGEMECSQWKSLEDE